jgi:hypothetical protein
MAVGITDKRTTVEDVVTLIDGAAPEPGRPKTYEKALKV